jgi:hypothetical protein
MTDLKNTEEPEVIEPIVEKLDDKIAKLNSSRVYKKITPRGTIDWYIKWVVSVIVLVAVMCRSVEEIPKIYDIVLSFFGCAGWAVVGYMWHDRALLLLNGVLCVVLGISILRWAAVMLG